jgi:hypothetical protein
LSGKDVAALNLEFRTRPIEVLSCQLGAAIFYDVGDAFDGSADFRPKSAAGMGLRILFPQFNRMVFRADVAFPFTRPPAPGEIDPVAAVVSFEQAFSMPMIGGRAAGSATSGWLGQ